MRVLASTLRLALVGGVAATAIAATLATPVHAAGQSTVEVRKVGVQLELVYTGSTDANDVLISTDATGAIVLSDSVPVVSRDTGCANLPGNNKIVRCSKGIARLVATLGDGADKFNSQVAFIGTVAGGGGNDTFLLGRITGSQPSAVVYGGGTGEDTADYSLSDSAAGVRVSLDRVGNDGRPAAGGRAADRDDIRVENITGSPFADLLTGDGAANRIEGRRGGDTIRAGGGNDSVLAQDGVADLTVDCGDGGTDRFQADTTDRPVSCEERIPAGSTR
ncbi:hypothetical protein ABGB17_11395 [Sphaerisporangium sp. B11E5]|uniref:hypothetical protein n=1 Tax=Sphaerisporangium sp. B11E5 TaxID=3153563 RepID=UPI00325C7BE3